MDIVFIIKVNIIVFCLATESLRFIFVPTFHKSIFPQSISVATRGPREPPPFGIRIVATRS